MSEIASAKSRNLRLFFALWPSEAHRAALSAAATRVVAEVQGQRVAPANLHVTLAFLGMVAGKYLPQLIEIGGQGPWPAVDVQFERVEYWAKPGVLVAMPAAVPAAGLEIVDRLWDQLEPLGFEREARPWQPHLTLLRRVRRPPPDNLVLAPVGSAGEAATWRLALVESSSHPGGVRYKPIADWPFS